MTTIKQETTEVDIKVEPLQLHIDEPIATDALKLSPPSSPVETATSPTCHICFARLTTTGNLKAHLRIHTDDRPHKCHVCRAAFREHSALRNHIMAHAGQASHRCSICGRTFVKKWNLTLHMRLHTGETPHKCAICSSEFERKDTLERHLRCHGIGPFADGRKSDSSRHTRRSTRKGCVCEECGKRFVDSYDLKVHRRVHTGERPHECDVCGKAFAHGSNMKKHRLRHVT